MMPAPAADVDDVGVGGSDGDGADGAGGLVIEERVPRGAVIGGAPDAAVIEADVENVGLAGDAGKGASAAGAGRADLSASASRNKASGRSLGRASPVPGEGASLFCECTAVQISRIVA
jgi:hypothetical protein